MKGDFTKAVFDPIKRFVRVLMQQGRVTLDADAKDPRAGNAGPQQPAPSETEAGGRNAEARKPD